MSSFIHLRFQEHSCHNLCSALHPLTSLISTLRWYILFPQLYFSLLIFIKTESIHLLKAIGFTTLISILWQFLSVIHPSVHGDDFGSLSQTLYIIFSLLLQCIQIQLGTCFYVCCQLDNTSSFIFLIKLNLNVKPISNNPLFFFSLMYKCLNWSRLAEYQVKLNLVHVVWPLLIFELIFTISFVNNSCKGGSQHTHAPFLRRNIHIYLRLCFAAKEHCPKVVIDFLRIIIYGAW